MIEIGDGAATDQRQCAAEAFGKARQQSDERRIRPYARWMVLYLEEGSVDIQEQGEPGRLQVIGRRRHRVTVPCGPPLVASKRRRPDSRRANRNDSFQSFASLL
jgi:hypothetical protein